MIIVIGATKGGAGKSTIATNLATVATLAGHETILVDCDKQGSSASWSGTRDEAGLPHVPTIQKFGGQAVTTELRELARKYKHVFVDAGGHDSAEMRAALLASDKLLVPLRPSQVDVWALPRIIEIAAQAHMYNPALSTLFVINGADTSPFVKETDDLIALADDVEGMVFCRTVLHLRRSFVKAMGLGKSVIEMNDEKATLEVQSLFEEIIGSTTND